MRHEFERAAHNVGELDKKATSLMRAAVADVRRELERLRVNPDGHRGTRTVAEAEADVRRRGRERIDALHREALEFAREALEELDGFEQSRQPAGEALAAAEAAWRRLEPLVATGWRIGDLAELAGRDRDAAALVALRARVPTLIGAALGPTAVDTPHYREAVADATATIDGIAERAGLMEPEDFEARQVRRRLEAIAPVIDRTANLARHEVAGQRSLRELAAERIAVGVAELAADQ